MGNVRILDIADALGLSTATVSNVIHGKTAKISRETEKRVQQKLEEMGYIPNMAGILLAQNSSRIVGVVINDHEKYEGHVLEDGFISSALNELSRAIVEAGLFMMVQTTRDREEIIRLASMWNMEGLVLIGFCDEDYIRLRDAMHVPFVVYEGYFSNVPGICNLSIDNFDGGVQVGTFFRDRGIRNVLCLADNYTCMDRERIEGVKSVMKPEEVDYMEVPMDSRERHQFYVRNLERFCFYEAIFAVSDYYAMDVIHFLKNQGFRIPEDFWVVGFDGSRLFEEIGPRLTTVKQDMKTRAKKAVEILQKLKQGCYESGDIIFPVQFVEQETTSHTPPEKKSKDRIRL